MSTAIISGTQKPKLSFKKAKFLYQFLLYLSPVILLTAIFPLVTPRIAHIQIGGIALSQIILAVSITVPWMSQSVCLPVYRAMDDLLGERNMDACMRRFAEYWVTTNLAVIPILVLFSLPFFFALNWSLSALAAYLILGYLNMAFSQLLVIANLPTDSRETWAYAWVAYAFALLVFPTVWFLPPVMGILVMLFVLRGQFRYLGAFKRLDLRVVSREMLRGFLMGTVLWADKYILFIALGGTMDVIAVYMGLIPAVIAYNYFFAAEASKIDRSVNQLRSVIENKGYQEVEVQSAVVENRVVNSTRRTLILAAVSSIIVAILMYFLTPASFTLAVSVIIASWLFLAVTIFCYQIDYLGSYVPPQVVGLAHLLLCTAAFQLIPHSGAYFIIMAGEAMLVAVSYVIFRRTWRTPAYDLFWRHAMTW